MTDLIDLRSDTVTQPCATMRHAMANAVVGDDVYGEDPTVQQLETAVAQLLDKPAGLFLPTGTMGNLTATLTHCQRGDEMLVGDFSHLYNDELGGASALAGVPYHPVRTQPDGTCALDDLARAIRPPGGLLGARTRAIVLETSHNRCGGVVLPIAYLRAVKQLADERTLRVHLDGARLFNAAVSLGIAPAAIAEHADSVQVCLSKGLGAPAGSVLAGSRAFIDEARRWRKMLGGGMRQVGVLAAAGLVALENIARLHEDHAHAQNLARGLAQISGINIDVARAQTNIVIFEIESLSVDVFLQRLQTLGVRMAPFGNGIRAVTHKNVGAAQYARVLPLVQRAMGHER